jgi:hypothetical protein
VYSTMDFTHHGTVILLTLININLLILGFPPLAGLVWQLPNRLEKIWWLLRGDLVRSCTYLTSQKKS